MDPLAFPGWPKKCHRPNNRKIFCCYSIWTLLCPREGIWCQKQILRIKNYNENNTDKISFAEFVSEIELIMRLSNILNKTFVEHMLNELLIKRKFPFY